MEIGRLIGSLYRIKFINLFYALKASLEARISGHFRVPLLLLDEKYK
jgi:hypothetical protein